MNDERGTIQVRGWRSEAVASGLDPQTSNLRPFGGQRLGDERGIALLTVALLLVALTVIGIAAVSVTGMENRMAGYGRSAETIQSAAEACMGTAVKIIQDTIDQGQLPASYLANASPAGPVPVSNGPLLQQEIMGQSDNNGDSPDSAPNTTATLFNFTVRGDIDRLYAAPKVGGSLQFAGGYEGTAGGAAGGGVDIYYRIDCVATNPALNTRGRITAVYACTASGETCLRKV